MSSGGRLQQWTLRSPKKVLDTAKQAGVRITAVLTTHDHRCTGSPHPW